MKSTTNVFLEGLITDRHPLSTPQNCLIDALNATLLTYNGNEMMLQNDMGNTRILDSATGNIMSLSPGFIPVGMKEHGGIMYIASVNKEGEGEIGTIPSPIIRDFYKDKLLILIDNKLSNTSYVSISNKIYPADKIMINLGLTVPTNLIVGGIYNENTLEPPTIPSGEEFVNIDPCDYYIKRFCILPPYSASDFAGGKSLQYSEVTSPIISYSPNVISNHTFNKGIFKVKLASKSIANVETEAPKSLYESQSGSNYWFHHTYDISQIFPSDLFEATLNGDLKSFPTDSKPGYLQVKLLNEGIKTFGMLQRAKHPINTPFSVKINDSKYETYFPGFYYTTESGIYVARIECEIIDQQTRELVQIILPDGSVKEYAEILFDRTTLTTNPELELKTVIGFKDSERNDHLSTAVINPSKSDGTISYPQVYNLERNEFYLTNITDITSIHTLYRSSTLDKDEKATIPYSGLFKIQLDDLTYTHWYKLTVFYYNQYDEKLGKYECTFNPLLNDVFGSNVFIDSIEGAEMKLLGRQYVDLAQIVTFKGNEEIFSYQAQIGGPAGRAFEGYVSWEDWIVNGTMVTLHSKSNAVKCSLLLPSDKKLVTIKATDNILQPMQKAPSYLYFCTSKALPELQSKLDVLTQFTMDCDQVRKDSKFARRYWDRFTVCNKLDYFGERYTMVVYINNSPSDENPVKIPYKIQWTRGLRDDFEKYPVIFAEGLLDISANVNHENLYTFSINAEAVFTNNEISGLVRVPYYDGLYLYSSAFVNRNNNEVDGVVAQFLYVTRSSDGITEMYIRPEIHLTPTLTIEIPEQLHIPAYQITPYFLLKYTDLYISKLHLTDSFFYNCNLELGDDDIPYNYLNWFLDINEATNDLSEFSYHQPQHKTLTKDTKITVNGLSSGIYVFNISAPSITNLLKDSALPIYISMTVGDKTTILNPYRVAGSTQIYYQNSNGYGTTMSHLWPVVICVDQYSDVEISIILDKGLELRYQLGGLYKLKNLPDLINSELIKEFSDECGYLFPDYQQKVLDIADKLPEEEQNSFKQTYGVFFRQAYSYVEGLYDLEKDILGDLEKLSNVISSITLGTTTYPNKAFVPAEPYILNYMWDKTPESKEPKVSKPCSAACLYCQPKEILTNRQDAKFKFFPTMENTEDCLTTQIRAFALTDTAISCQPGNSTVLIKNNNADEN